MYRDYYGFSQNPFSVSPDPDFFYLSPSHKHALSALVDGVNKRVGFVSITGDIGLGKTTILRYYLEQIEGQKIKTILIFNPNVSFVNLLKSIYLDLDLSFPGSDDLFEVLQDLRNVLNNEYERGNNIILIVDEVQRMPLETLEQVRLLSNLEADNEKLLQIILVGQKEFDEMLSSKELGQIRQRIGVRRTLEPLGPEESLDYIRHRLSKVTDDPDSVFTRKALRRIIKHSQGIPRKINIICDNALITTMGHGGRSVSPRIVEEVVADLDGRPMKSRLRPALAAVGVLPAVLLGTGWLLLSPHPVVSKIVQLDALRSFFHASPGEQTAPPEQVVQTETHSAQNGILAPEAAHTGTESLRDEVLPPVAFPEQFPARSELSLAPEKSGPAQEEVLELPAGRSIVDRPENPSSIMPEAQVDAYNKVSERGAPAVGTEWQPVESRESVDEGNSNMRSPLPPRESASNRSRPKDREPDPGDIIDWVLKERTR
jgi:general secretion pathway protein A